jgi:two-component sensor histidine kinase
MSLTDQTHLGNGHIYDEKTAGNLQVLLENISSLNRAIELQTVLRESLNVIQKVMNVEASSLMLLDESTGELIVSMPTGPVRKEIAGERIEQGTGIGGWVLQNERPFYTNDPQNSEKFAGDLSDNFTTKNIICVPLIDKRGDIFGVMQAINRLDDKGFGEQDVPVFQSLADNVAVAIERTRELEKVQKNLKEKEMMLTEVHHRLKNNLSTITALIEMEFSEVSDENARHVLEKSCARIDSMTEVHDLLYNTGLENQISLDSYLKRLAEKVSNTISPPSQNIEIEIDAEAVELDSERAMSCGLLLNELLMNCYKHAFKNRSGGGCIRIELTKSDNQIITLKVSDNGEGVGDKFKLGKSDSTGGWLINVLIRRLDATVDISQNNGTMFLIRFEN